MQPIVGLSGRKEKLGTILDTEIVRMIKERALKEGRSISDIIQEAVLNCNILDQTTSAIRVQAAKRYCSSPMKISRNDLDELLNEDYCQA
ncbi:MAG: hypothetical protein HYV28_03815 [Ignavibacteriales bacterium]|nr:hypothetical protein [Ignavibacteriales bacterium]